MTRQIKVTLELDNDDGKRWKMCYHAEFDNVAFHKEAMNYIHSQIGVDLGRILSGGYPTLRTTTSANPRLKL